jgi:hypothetical protein
MANDARRRALAVVLHMGASISQGTVTMLETENWYAAATLTRQLVEVEYLTWLFGSDSSEAEA